MLSSNVSSRRATKVVIYQTFVTCTATHPLKCKKNIPHSEFSEMRWYLLETSCFRSVSRATRNNKIHLNRERFINPSIGIGSLMCYLPPIAAPKTHQRQVYKDIFLPRMATFDQKKQCFPFIENAIYIL